MRFSLILVAMVVATTSAIQDMNALRGSCKCKKDTDNVCKMASDAVSGCDDNCLGKSICRWIN